MQNLSKDHFNVDGSRNGNGYIISENLTVICFTCTKATEKGLLRLADNHSTFVRGFSNWKKACEKFAQHELSELHSDSVRTLASLKLTPINAMLSNVAAQEQAMARTGLKLLFRSIKLLGRQGLPLRGHDHRNGNLWQVMLERTHNLRKAREWMLRRDNWMSDKIENEILEMFAHAIQRDIMSEMCHRFFLGTHSRWYH